MMVDNGQRRWGGKNWGNALVADDDCSGRPLQCPLAHVPGERGADEECDAKTTVGGGGIMGATMGLQRCNDEYGAKKVASAAPTIRQSTIQQ